MEKTLANKYGMTAAEIEMAKAGTYTGSVDSDLIKRIKKTTDLERKERDHNNKVRETQLNPTKNLTPQQKDLFRGGGADRDPPSAPQKATETSSYSNQSAYEQASGTGNNNSNNTGSTKSSQGTTTSQHQAFRN